MPYTGDGVGRPRLAALQQQLRLRRAGSHGDSTPRSRACTSPARATKRSSAAPVNLTDYDTVIWILGNESTANDTFNATEQTKVTQFITAGGNLFLSGSEIGWDLDQQNNGRTFYENTLKGNYVSDDAGTYTATADAGGIFAGMSSFVFSNGTAFSQPRHQMYNVDFARRDRAAGGRGCRADLQRRHGRHGGDSGAGTGGKRQHRDVRLPVRDDDRAQRAGKRRWAASSISSALRAGAGGRHRDARQRPGCRFADRADLLPAALRRSLTSLPTRATCR